MGLNRGLCKWQSQEQLPLQRSCSPIAQTTVYEPGYGQLVLILKLPPSSLTARRSIQRRIGEPWFGRARIDAIVGAEGNALRKRHVTFRRSSVRY
jgi:hypothetical protein